MAAQPFIQLEAELLALRSALAAVVKQLAKSEGGDLIIQLKNQAQRHVAETPLQGESDAIKTEAAKRVEELFRRAHF